MNRKILYFINPVSGPRRKPLLIESITEKTLEQGIPFQIAFTNASAEYPELVDKIKNEGNYWAREKNHTRLIECYKSDNETTDGLTKLHDEIKCNSIWA